MNDLAELLTRSCVTEGCTCHEAALVRAIRELIAERDAFYAASVGIQEGIRAAERERIATLAMAQSDALYRTCDHDSQPDGWYVLQDFAETIRALGDK